MEYTKFYFYSNQNFVRDIFTSNVISCPASSKKERAVSFGTVDRLSLFLTHKKLKRELRMINLSPQVGDFPVLVEVSVPKNKDIDVLLASQKGGEYVVEQGKISAYNPEQHIGCFWRGFIPFSFISGFLFENEKDKIDIYIPSPDFWLPNVLFGELNDTEFSEELDFEKLLHRSAVNPAVVQQSPSPATVPETPTETPAALPVAPVDVLAEKKETVQASLFDAAGTDLKPQTEAPAVAQPETNPEVPGIVQPKANLEVPVSPQSESPIPPVSEEEIVCSVVSYNKFRAMLYYAVKATRNWVVGKYELNVDSYVLDILGINQETVIPEIKQMIDSADQASVQPADLLLPQKGDVFSAGADPQWKAVHDTIVNELLKTDVTTTFDQQQFSLLRNAVLSAAVSTGEERFEKLCSEYLNKIDTNLYRGTLRGGPSVEDLLSYLSDALPLKALLFVLKCPHPTDKLEEVLEAYHVDCVTARIAEVYFAAINGFVDLHGTEKSDFLVNLAIDQYAAEHLSSAIPCVMSSAEEYSGFLPDAAKAELAKGFAVSCCRITTWGEIHAFFSGEIGLLRLEATAGKMWLDTLFTRYGNSGLKRLGTRKDEYVYYEVNQAALMNPLTSTEFDSLVKSSNAAAFVRKLYVPKFKSQEFFSAFIVPRNEFSKLYTIQPEFWNELFKKRIDVVKPPEAVKPTDVGKPTETAKQPEAVKQTDAVKPTDIGKPIETAKQPEAVKQTDAVKPTDIGKPTKTAKRLEVVKQTDAVKQTDVVKQE